MTLLSLQVNNLVFVGLIVPVCHRELLVKSSIMTSLMELSAINSFWFGNVRITLN